MSDPNDATTRRRSTRANRRATLAFSVLLILAPAQVVAQERHRQIDVLAVDQKGKPVAGAPIALVSRYRSWGQRSRKKKTDSRGRVRFLEADEPAADNWGSTLLVKGWFPQKDGHGVNIDLATFKNNPAQPVRLQLPPFGQIRVYVTDPNNKPLKGIETVFLRAANEFGMAGTVFEASEVKEDYATFPFVEVGYEAQVWCRYQGMIRPQLRIGWGPKHPNTMSIVTLGGVTAPTTVTPRLLGTDGQPVRSEEIGLTFTIARDLHCATATTDALGRLPISIPDNFLDADGHLTITRRGKGDRLVYRGAARIPLPSVATEKTVTLKEETLLCRGRVVDASGKPVSGVEVSVPNSQFPKYAWRPRVFAHPKFFEHRAVTGELGRFELREVGDAPANVSLSSSQNLGFYIVSGVEHTAGADDVKVVVGRTGGVRGSFAGFTSEEYLPVDIELHAADGTRIPTRMEGALVGERPRTFEPEPVLRVDGGQFELLHCPTGSFSLVFKLTDAPKPFLVVSKVEVVAGKMREDPRLQNIDLAKFFKMITLTVRGPDKKPMAWSFAVSHARTDLIRTQRYPADSSGQIKIPIPAKGSNISIGHVESRYRIARLPMQKEDAFVDMTPSWPVRVTITNLPDLPGNLGFRGYISQVRAMNDWGTPGTQIPYFYGKHKAIDFDVDDPGRYRLSLYPQIRFGDRQDATMIMKGAGIAFRLKASDDVSVRKMFEHKLTTRQLAEIKEYIGEANRRMRSGR